MLGTSGEELREGYNIILLHLNYFIEPASLQSSPRVGIQYDRYLWM